MYLLAGSGAANQSWFDKHVSIALWLQGVGVVVGVAVAILVAYRELPRLIAESRLDDASERLWTPVDIHVVDIGRSGTRIRITLRYVGTARLRLLQIVYGTRGTPLAANTVPGVHLGRARRVELDLGPHADEEHGVEKTKFCFAAKIGGKEFEFDHVDCTWYETDSEELKLPRRAMRAAYRQIRYGLTPPRIYVLISGVLLGIAIASIASLI